MVGLWADREDAMQPRVPGDGLPCAYGKYELLARIGQGGMAEVFLARLPGAAGFEKILVIKRLFPHLAREPGILEMFVNEAKIAAEIHHRNIVQVYELCQGDDGELYIAMEHIAGADLRQILRGAAVSSMRIPPWFSLRVVVDILDGLAHVHGLQDSNGRPRNIVHRDVTPANIFVSHLGDIKLGDFGIAKDESRQSKTQAGQLKGKVPYMSPEQLYARELDGRSDVFAVGVVLWECLTQRRLFGGRPDIAAMNLICNGERSPPSSIVDDIPPELDEIVLAALAPNPDHRPSSATELQSQLLRVLHALRPRVSSSDVRSLVEVLVGNLDPSPSLGPASTSDPGARAFLEATPSNDAPSAQKISTGSLPPTSGSGVLRGASVVGSRAQPAPRLDSQPQPAPRLDSQPRLPSPSPGAAPVPRQASQPGTPSPRPVSQPRLPPPRFPPPFIAPPPRFPPMHPPRSNSVVAAESAPISPSNASSGSPLLPETFESATALSAPPTRAGSQREAGPDAWVVGDLAGVVGPVDEDPLVKLLASIPATVEAQRLAGDRSREPVAAAVELPTHAVVAAHASTHGSTVGSESSRMYEGPHPLWVRLEGGAVVGPLGPLDALELVQEQGRMGLTERLGISSASKRWMDGTTFAVLTGQELLLDPFGDNAKPLPEAAFCGTLENTSIPALFARLARERPTGRLIITADVFGQQRRRELVLREGRPTFVYGNSPEVQLPQLLVDRKVLTTEQLDGLLYRVVEEDRPLDELTAIAVGVDASKLFGALMKERLQELLCWRLGRFALDPDAPITYTTPFAHTLLGLVPELIVSTHAVEDLRLILAPCLDTRLERTEMFSRGLADLGLPDREMNLVQRFSLLPSGAAIERGTRDEHRLLALVYTMVEAGMLRPQR